jgi:glycosyltransferase involved in cell wall biosynthesis
VVNIGLIHSMYRSSIPSGENSTVLDISNTLETIGHKINKWFLNSDSIIDSPLSKASRALEIISPTKQNKAEFEKWLGNQDTIQIHNYFPALTLNQLDMIKESGIQITRVIHNYRKTCLVGTHVRKGQSCYKCDLNSKLTGMAKGCFNKSQVMSTFMAFYSKKIEIFEKEADVKYVAISRIILEYLISLGIDKHRISLIENSVPRTTSISSDASEVLLLCRLEVEKGVLKALEVWSKNPHLPKLNIIGSGSLEKHVKIKSQVLKNVQFHGFLSGVELNRVVNRCKVCIFPNSWNEPFGRTFAEALARGQAIVAFDMGMASDFINENENGYLVSEESDFVFAINKAMLLPFDTHLATSKDLWKSHYSPSVTKDKWDAYYKRVPLLNSNSGSI